MRISDYLRRGEQIERSSALLAVNEMVVNNEPGSAVIEGGREGGEGGTATAVLPLSWRW